MGKQRASIMVCDNPDCRKSELTSKEEPAQGYYLGRGMWSLAGGGPIPAIYACSEECILPAIRYGMDHG